MTQAALVQVASNFVAAADVAEIEAYRWGDASRAAGFYGGVALQNIASQIAVMRQNGVYAQNEADFPKSYIQAVRNPRPDLVEVDACEVWRTSLVNAFTGQLMRTEPSRLVPQTLIVQQVGQQFLIMDARVYAPPSFCNR